MQKTKTVKIHKETAQRIDKIFKSIINKKLLVRNNTSLEMVERASWNLKIKSILDELEKVKEEG